MNVLIKYLLDLLNLLTHFLKEIIYCRTMHSCKIQTLLQYVLRYSLRSGDSKIGVEENPQISFCENSLHSCAYVEIYQ